MINQKTYTIKEVAEEAGVSKSTVSRVLNNSPYVNRATRARILKLIKDLEYEPSNIARTLKGKQSFTIGVILEDLLNPFYMEVAQGIETSLKKAGYRMLLTSSNWDYKEEVSLVKILLRDRVDGILINTISPDSDAVELLLSSKVPFIMVDCKSDDSVISWVTGDNVKGGYIATKYFIQLGFRNLLCIKGRNNQATHDRLEGLKQAVKEQIKETIMFNVIGNARFADDGELLLTDYIKKVGVTNVPEAIFATNDFVAIGAIDALQSNNLRVPEDVSVIGYDDVYLAKKVRVPLTTVHQSKFRMGEIAAVQVIDIIQNQDLETARQIMIPPRLIVRQSCKSITRNTTRVE